MADLSIDIAKFDPGRFGEVLPQEVGSAPLKSLAVLGHRFNRPGRLCPRELLGRGLLPFDHRDGKMFLDESGIRLEHAHRLFPGLSFGGMGGHLVSKFVKQTKIDSRRANKPCLN